MGELVKLVTRRRPLQAQEVPRATCRSAVAHRAQPAISGRNASLPPARFRSRGAAPGSYVGRMGTGVKELKLWQEAVALAGDVVRLVRQLARRETKSFTDRLMHAAVAVATAVAEGYGRYDSGEQRRLYLAARRSLAELETQLAIARHAGLIPPSTVAQLTGRTSTVARLLSGYLSYIDRQLAADGRSLKADPPSAAESTPSILAASTP